MKNAKKCLVAVLQKNYKSENFDELRYEQYIDKKQITDWTCTNILIYRKTLKSLLLYSIQFNQFNQNLIKDIEWLDPVMYVWKSTHDAFLPEKREKEMPAEYTITCNCKIRCTPRCECVKNDVFCTIFCKCQNQKCNND